MAEDSVSDPNSNEKLKSGWIGMLKWLGLHGGAATVIVGLCWNYLGEMKQSIRDLSTDMRSAKEQLAEMKSQIQKDREQDDVLTTHTTDIKKLTSILDQVSARMERLPRTISAQWGVIRGQEERVGRVEVITLSNERILDKMQGFEPRRLKAEAKEVEEKKKPNLLKRLKDAFDGKPQVKIEVKEPLPRVPDTDSFRKNMEDRYQVQNQQQEFANEPTK